MRDGSVSKGRLAEIVGIPFATFDNWVAQDCFVPSIAHQPGQWRRYSEIDVIRAAVMREMLRHAYPLDLAWQEVSSIISGEDLLEELRGRLLVVYDGGPLLVMERDEVLSNGVRFRSMFTINVMTIIRECINEA